jgi:hypothetical protein
VTLTSTTQPTTVRQLDTPAATALADLTSMLDDLQTVLLCCERLVTELEPTTGRPDELMLEAYWTTALLSYSRCFVDAGRGMALTEADISATPLEGEVLAWHGVLLQMREHYTAPADNPRQRFAVAAAQDTDGNATGLAITSTPQPTLDDLTVRQTGALAYKLSEVVQQRIVEQQELVLTAAKAMTPAELGALQAIDLVTLGAPADSADAEG